MPKVTIEYTDEEQTEALRALQARDLWCALWDFRECLRARWKHSDERTVQIDELWESFNEQFGEFLDD